MTDEEFWKQIGMQQQHEKELVAISEILSKNKDGSTIRALYLMCKMVDRDFQRPGGPSGKDAELVRDAANTLAKALVVFSNTYDINLEQDLEILKPGGMEP